MEINITFIGQLIAFIFYILFCMKYIWPYINKVIEKRQKKIYISFLQLEKNKNKIIKINNLIESKIKKYKDRSYKIIFNAKIKGKYIIDQYKLKANLEYNKIISDAKLNIKIEKKKMYDNFNKNISKLIEKILFNITSGFFNKDLDDKYIKKMLNKL